MKAPPEMPSAGWLIADVDSGDILAAGNPNGEFAPASTIKTLTALALLPKLDLDAVHTVSHAEAAMEGSAVGITEGSTYTNRDLLTGLLLDSGNDAAAALATSVGGLDVAVDLMNERAKKAGATNTVAKNTSGLDADGQVTTAHDLAVIAREALKDPVLSKVFVTRQYQFPGKGDTLDDTRERYAIGNHNQLVLRYEGATGVKTGYTNASRHTYIGSAKRDGRHLVVTMLKSEGRAWKSAAALLDWAFELPSGTKAVGSLADPVPDEPEPTATAAATESVRAVTNRAVENSVQVTEHSRVRQISIAAAVLALAAVGAGLVLRYAPKTNAARSRVSESRASEQSRHSDDPEHS